MRTRRTLIRRARISPRRMPSRATPRDAFRLTRAIGSGRLELHAESYDYARELGGPSGTALVWVSGLIDQVSTVVGVRVPMRDALALMRACEGVWHDDAVSATDWAHRTLARVRDVSVA